MRGNTTSVQTSAVGANWVPFPDIAAELLKVFNDTGTTIEMRRASTAVVFTVASGDNSGWLPCSSADDWEVHRQDNSGVQVTVKAALMGG